MVNIIYVLKSNEQKMIASRYSHDVHEKHTSIVNFIVKNYNLCLRTIKIDNV